MKLPPSCEQYVSLLNVGRGGGGGVVAGWWIVVDFFFMIRVCKLEGLPDWQSIVSKKKFHKL